MATKWASASAGGGGAGTEADPYTLAEIQAAAASGDTLVLIGNFDATSLSLTSKDNVTVVSGHVVNSAYARATFRNRLTASGPWTNIPTTNAYTISLAATPWKVVVDWDTTTPDAYGFRACNLQRYGSAAGVQTNSNTFHTNGVTLTVNLAGDDPNTKTILYAVARPGIKFTACANPSVIGCAFEWCNDDSGTPDYGVITIDCTGVPQISGCLFTECGWHASGFYSTSGDVAGHETGNTFIGCLNDSCSVAYSGTGTVSNVVYFGNTYYCSTPLKRGGTVPLFRGSESGPQGAPGITAHQASATATGVTDIKIVNCRFVCPPYTRTGTSTTNAGSPIICRNNPVPSNTANPATYAIKVVNCDFVGFEMLSPLAPYAHAYVGCRFDFGGAPTFIAGGVGIGIVGRIFGGGSNTNGYIGSFGTQWAFDLDATSGTNPGGAFFVSGGVTTANRTFYYFDKSTVYNYGDSSNTSQPQNLFRWTSSTNVAGDGGIVARDSVFAHRAKPSAGSRFLINTDTRTVTITAASAANPCQLTNSGSNNLTAGQSVLLSGMDADLNGMRQVVSVIDSTHFTVNVDKSGGVTDGTGSAEVDVGTSLRDFKRCIFGNIGTYSSNTSYDTESEWLASIDTAGQAYAASIIEPVSGSGELRLGSKYRNPPKAVAPSSASLGSNGYPTSLSPGSAQFNASRARSRGWSRSDRVSR